ncbi:MAG TPA: hypothetical protein VMF35_01480 [Acidimicrobiales bacterium]|nr:hypothetical protein [Acidimicrobiales bacterium]
MVLVAPSPLVPDAATDDGTRSEVPGVPSGRDLLALLRGDHAARPSFDPGLAGGVRAWLEDAAFETASVRAERAGSLMLGARQILGTATTHDTTDVAPRLVDRLVHALFRQLVFGCRIEDPLGDGLDALRAAGDEETVRGVAALGGPARAALGTTLDRHIAHLSALVPRFAPGWMPRTDDYVAIPLAGGAVVLHGVFDLLVGIPQSGTASLCALGLSTGGPWPRERRTLHFLALLELLRTGTPPFRVALLESATGRYGVEDISEEHLRAMAAHVAGWLGRSDTCA